MHTSDADTIEIERSSIKGLYNILADITRRLYARQLVGKAIIITEHPEPALAVAQRFWQRMTQQLLTKRASHEHLSAVADLTQEIAAMQSYRFTVSLPHQDPQCNVFILHPRDLKEIFPTCQSLFVLSAISQEALDTALSYMPPRSLVMVYDGPQ